MSDPKKLNPEEIDVDSLEVTELDEVAGGAGDLNGNCYSCTCPPRQQDPIFVPDNQVA